MNHNKRSFTKSPTAIVQENMVVVEKRRDWSWDKTRVVRQERKPSEKQRNKIDKLIGDFV